MAKSKVNNKNKLLFELKLKIWKPENQRLAHCLKGEGKKVTV